MKITAHYSGSDGNLYTIDNGTDKLLIECGVPFAKIIQAINYRLSEYAGCLISHEHKDHCKAVSDLIKMGCNCYMSEGTYEALKKPMTLLIENNSLIEIKSFKILPFSIQHDAKEPLGFLIRSGHEKLLYATDTYYLRNRFSGLTHMMIECNWSEKTLREDLHPARINRLRSSHMSLENLIEMLKSNDLREVQEIWLLHMSKSNADSQFFKSEIEKETGKLVILTHGDESLG